MYPRNIIIERKTFYAGETIFKQDDSPECCLGLESGEAALYFDTSPLTNQTTSAPFATVTGPFPLLEASASGKQDGCCFTAVCLSAQAVVCYWSPVKDYDCPAPEKMAFLSTICHCNQEVMRYLSHVIRAGTMIDTALRLYNGDVLKIVDSLERHIRRWQSVNVNSFPGVEGALKALRNHLPPLAHTKMEKMLQETGIRQTVTVNNRDVFHVPTSHSINDIIDKEPAVFIVLEGDVDICFGKLQIMQCGKDSFFGLHTFFMQRQAEYVAADDCLIRCVCRGKPALQRLLETPSGLAQALAESVLRNYTEGLLYAAFLSNKNNTDWSILCNGDNSYRQLLVNLLKRMEGQQELNYYMQQLRACLDSLSLIANNCLQQMQDNRIALPPHFFDSNKTASAAFSTIA